MRKYLIKREADGVHLYRTDDNGETLREITPEASLRLRNHSPTGFEYGYLGSGPSQLSLAILLDAFGYEYHALATYQKLKRNLISQLNGQINAHIITYDQIKESIEERKEL